MRWRPTQTSLLGELVSSCGVNGILLPKRIWVYVSVEALSNASLHIIFLAPRASLTLIKQREKRILTYC